VTELMSIEVGDGSWLILGVWGVSPQPETNVSPDAQLVFQHKRLGVDADVERFTDGTFNAHYPVMVGGRSHVVFTGEVDACVDAVLLRLSLGNEPPYAEYLAQVAEPLGRRVWMSHPQPLLPRMAVWVAWLHGEPERISVMPDGVSYGPPSAGD
jgi:hypothetical protein